MMNLPSSLALFCCFVACAYASSRDGPSSTTRRPSSEPEQQCRSPSCYGQSESLLFDNSQARDEKLFYMYGDERFGGGAVAEAAQPKTERRLRNPASSDSSVIGDVFTPKLPQDATTAERIARRAQVLAELPFYRYRYDATIPEAPTLASPDPEGKLMQPREMPSLKWQGIAVNVLKNIITDVLPSTIIDCFKHPEKLAQLFEIIKPKTFDVRPTNIDDYQVVYGPEKPFVVREFQMDAAFARWRLAGPNPVTIERCTQEILDTKANLDALSGAVQAVIQKALRDRRLFVVDYSVLATIKPGKSGPQQKYTVGPLALFEIPEDADLRRRQYIQPLAIQVDKMDLADPTKPRPAVFTPADGVGWTMAKAIFDNADVDFHEGVVHFGLAHHLIEPLMIATHRSLPVLHPLNVLLLPHFEGTSFSNYLAEHTLFIKNATVDLLVSQDIVDLDVYIGRQVLETLSNDFTLPTMLKRRGMDAESFPAPYPYRDDGLLYWTAIREWVNDYLSIYYGPSPSVAADRIAKDYELQAWIRECATVARAGWFNKFDGTLDMLVEMVTGIVFTATAHHASINFSLEEMQAYAPAFPMALYQPPPSMGKELTNQDYLDILPPLESAWAQRKLLSFIGGLHYTTLGQYKDGHFRDSRVGSALSKFQTALEQIGDQVRARNVERVAAWSGVPGMDPEIAQNWAYNYMLPENVPQSINI